MAPKLTAAEFHFPPALLKNPSEEVSAYYKWVCDGLRLSAPHQPEKAAILRNLETLSENPALKWHKEETT